MTFSHANLLLATSITESDLPTNLQRVSSDISHVVTDNFTIDDARNLTNQSFSKGFAGQRIFVIQTSNITIEAQNALLKLFEEPPQGVTFYLIIPNQSILIPTLLSRLIKQTPHTNTNPIDETINSFIKSSKADRLETIAKLAKADSSVLKNFLAKLTTTDLKDPDFKQSLALLNRYLNTRGASRKMLAEEIALSLKD